MSFLDQVINKAQATIPMDRQVQGLHLLQKAKKVVVGDRQPVFVDEAAPDVDELDLTEIDLSNPFLYGQGRWQSYFARLRDEAPVHYQANSPFGPFWSVTRYDDILTVDKDFETYSAEPQIVIGTPPAGLDVEMFIAMDPPRHDQQRGAVQGVVAPQNLEEMETLIRSRVQEVLDDLPVHEPFDWVDKVSIELTSRMLATLLDFPYEQRRKLVYWTEMTAASGSRCSITRSNQRRSTAARSFALRAAQAGMARAAAATAASASAAPSFGTAPMIAPVAGSSTSIQSSAASTQRPSIRQASRNSCDSVSTLIHPLPAGAKFEHPCPTIRPGPPRPDQRGEAACRSPAKPTTRRGPGPRYQTHPDRRGRMHSGNATIARVDAQLVARYRAIKMEVAARLPAARLIDSAIRPLVPAPGWRVAGPALTVALDEPDALMSAAAVAVAQAGDVILVCTGGDCRRAVWGGGLSRSAARAGVAGIVVDGRRWTRHPCWKPACRCSAARPRFASSRAARPARSTSTSAAAASRRRRAIWSWPMPMARWSSRARLRPG